jgi:hypothetical protein
MAGLVSDDNANVMVALTFVGVLVLLYKAFDNVKWRMPFEQEQAVKDAAKQGVAEAFLPGSSLAHVGVRSDTGFVNRHLGAGTEALGAYEPPTFWNGGDYAAVGDHQRASARADVVNTGFDGSDRRTFDTSLDGVGSAHATKFGMSTEGMNNMRLGYEGMVGVRVGGHQLNPY